MLCRILSRGQTLSCCLILAVVSTTIAREKQPKPPGPQDGKSYLSQEIPQLELPQHGKYPPATFVAPPGNPTDGAIIMHPPIPPGPVIWQRGQNEHGAIRPSDHWIGVQCGMMIPALRTQLELDEDQGVLVEAVVDDGPAAKAGIEKHDVLLQAGDRKLTKVQDLIDEVDAVKDSKLSIQLIHKGKKKTVELTPQKRPPVEALGEDAAEAPADEWKKFFDYMQKWEPGEDGRPSMKLQFWRQPGTILPSPPKHESRLPDNVKIRIIKQGDKPAEIHVTRDNQTWDLNEDELDKLPEDLRPHIERQLGRQRGPGVFWNYVPKDIKVPNPLEGREDMIEKRFEQLRRRIEKLPNPLEGRVGDIEKRFEEMNRRLEKLDDTINDFLSKPADKPDDKPKEKPKKKLRPEPKPDEPKPEPTATEA